MIAILPFRSFSIFRKPEFRRAHDRSGRIYDRRSPVEFSRHAHLLNLASALGLNLGSELMMANVASESEMYVEFTWNRLVLLHEADQLGIRPSSTEIAAFVKTLPRFKGEGGGFDPQKYDEFTTVILPSMGFKEAQIEEVVSDQLAVTRIKDLLATGPKSRNPRTRKTREGLRKMEVAVVRLREETSKRCTFPDEYSRHITRQYGPIEERGKRGLNLSRSRSRGERTDRKDRRIPPKVADRANDSPSPARAGSKFEKVASRFQVVTSREISRLRRTDPKLAAIPQLTQYSFQLLRMAPFSVPPGPTLLFLTCSLAESNPLTLEEAKPKIADTLKSERLRGLTATKGAEVARQLRDALKTGTALEKVAEQSGLKLERIPSMALVEVPAPDKPKPEKPKEEAPDCR